MSDTIQVEPYGEPPARKRFWTRPRKVVAAALALLLVAATAFALFEFFRPIRGGGTINAPTNIQFTSATLSAGSGSTAVCSASLNGGDNVVTINLSGDPGDWCQFVFGVQATGRPATLVVQDIRFATEVLEQFLPGECGKAIPAAPSTTSVEARFTIPAGSPPGTFSFQPDAGFYAGPATNPACPHL